MQGKILKMHFFVTEIMEDFLTANCFEMGK